MIAGRLTMTLAEMISSRSRLADEPVKLFKLKRMVGKWPKHSYGAYVRDKDTVTRVVLEIYDRHCDFCDGRGHSEN